MPTFEWRSRIAVPAEELYAWHARPGAFERLTAPWHRVHLVEQRGGIEDGDQLTFDLRLGPTWQRWVAVHRDHVPGHQFVDEQVDGPFDRWVHTHRFLPDGDTASLLEDRIEYELPYGSLGETIGEAAARRQLERLFRFRHRRTALDVERHHHYVDRPRLRVAIAGATGLLGSALAAFLSTGGHEVLRLVRAGRLAGGPEIAWDPAAGTVDVDRLAGVDAVVNVAGATTDAPWTASHKHAILTSRVQSTDLLARTIAGLKSGPRVFLAQSAIGYYGETGSDIATEESPPRPGGFLTSVCSQWEAAAAPAHAAGARVAVMRTGLVFTAAGGAVAKAATAFRLGIGGAMGSGRQWMSWIALDDFVGAALALLYDERLEGPVNVVSPSPVTNREFSDTLARVLRRPAVVPLSERALKLTFGRERGAAMLESARVVPRRLQDAGFEFALSHLEDALRFELGRE